MLLNVSVGLLVGFLVMYLTVLPRGRVLGGADIKLMASTGAFLGPAPILNATLIGSTVAFAVTKLRIALKHRPTDMRIALVPFLNVGILSSAIY